MASDQEKRKLTELRVVELRSELEKRGIDKMGVKAVLTERLVKALEEEGHDPESYVFEPFPKMTPKRAKARGDMDTESESQSNADDAHDLSLDVDDEIRDELSIKVEDAQAETSLSKLEESKDISSDVDTKLMSDMITAQIKVEVVDEVVKEDVEVEQKEVIKENADVLVTQIKDESQDDATTVKLKDVSPIKAVPVAKPKAVVVKPAEVEKQVPDTNGVDNEDSINLDIGEDEEKLLADEDDSCSQEKDHKDEGDRAGKNQENGGEAKKEGAKDEERKQSSADEKAGKTQEELKDDKTKSSSDQKSKDDKDKAKKSSAGSSSSSRNLWVSGLSSATRATDLKQVFSKYGKVIGAKVVTNARTPGARCYGYVTMATGEEAAKCIQYLHRTELHGRMISVEKAKGESGPPRRGDSSKAVSAVDKKRHERKPITIGKPNVKQEEKKKDVEDAKKDGTKADSGAKADKSNEKIDETAKADGKEKSPEDASKAKEGDEKESEAEKEKRTRDLSRERKEKRRIVITHTRSRSPHRPRPPIKNGSPARKPRPLTSLLTFNQIREERERNRARERERDLREESRRNRILMEREKEIQRDIQRKQREEAMRLEREKEKLRIEREKIEMERAELLRLERDRQRLERERLEREREELKRQQLRSALKSQASHHRTSHHLAPTERPIRFEEARRTIKRPAEDRRDAYPDDRKRVTSERRFEPPPTRFEESRANDFPLKKDVRRSGEFPPPRRSDPTKFVRSAFVPPETRPSRREPSPEIPSRREHIAPAVGLRSGKDNRFERGAAPSFRERDERRPENDHRAKVDPRQSSRDRYQDSSKSTFSSSKAGEGRYTDRAGSTWHAGSAGPPPVKPFGSALGSSVMPPRDAWASAERKTDSQSWSRPMDSGWTSSSGPILSRGGPTLGGSSLYSSSSQNLPPSMSGLGMSSSSGPYNSDRFDSYKQPMLRKY